MKKLFAKLALFVLISTILNISAPYVFANAEEDKIMEAIKKAETEKDPFKEMDIIIDAGISSYRKIEETTTDGQTTTTYEVKYNSGETGTIANTPTPPAETTTERPEAETETERPEAETETETGRRDEIPDDGTPDETEEEEVIKKAEETAKEIIKELRTCNNDSQCKNYGETCEEGYCVVTLKESTFDVSGWLKLDNGQDQSYFNDPQGRTPIVSFIISVIDFATKIIGSMAIILFIAAGFMMMVSKGNQQQIDSAKDMFKYAIVGLLVTFVSYLLITAIQSFFDTA